MQQLTALDASFLHMEDARVTAHTGGLMILDPSTAEKPIDVAAIREHYAARIPHIAALRWRLVEVPMGMDLPYWYDDHDVDLDYHIRSSAVPAPGGQEQLLQLVSRLHEGPLDRSRPLWQLYVIEGLEGGKVATFLKTHHAAFDGKANMALLSTLLTTDPRPEPLAPPAQMPPSESRPSDLEMLQLTASALMARPGKLAELVTRGLADWQTFATSQLGKPLRGSAPRLSINRSLTPRREYVYGAVPFADVARVKTAQGCTVNDVVMAMCAGAMRSWLSDRDELPDGPIRAMVPVSIRTDEGSAGNQVASMAPDLPTHLATARERLDAVRSEMAAAKEEFKAVPAALLLEFGNFAAPAASELVARSAASLRLADKVSLPFNVVISNVPGPREELYLAGARCVGHYPVSMVSDGMGLNITVISHGDTLAFGLTSCPDLVPDVSTIIDHLEEELAELVALG
ncbi:wax ester/triacylglycerol synthase family O-acyltransferase [Nocardioides albidus]|uniref:Diacylglycerol O-acyltransferase n=1 Tax=Nocardioides albidus TaxID=1517589 RepID=A0A5C4VUV3_9ACTN|nr:wax ester/triacylglycerol synthase family O-acyltransferase [Nocardioides albidus]TNM39607.1 wax ester/triacylglycerol synthase family O-acyltransferase [Nocardioides albidus]